MTVAGDMASAKRAFDAEHPKVKNHTLRRWAHQWRCFWTWPLGHRWMDNTGLSARCAVCGRRWIGNL